MLNGSRHVAKKEADKVVGRNATITSKHEGKTHQIFGGHVGGDRGSRTLEKMLKEQIFQTSCDQRAQKKTGT